MRTYKRCTEQEVFGLGIFLPLSSYKYIAKYRKKIRPLVEWFVKARYSYPGTNKMRPHITIKYLGYHKKYSNKEIKKLTPKIKEISKKYLPLEIKIKGLNLGMNPAYYPCGGILLDFKPKTKVRRFHQDIIQSLKVDIYKNIDRSNFDPHIALAEFDMRKADIKKLKEIVKESKKDKELRIRLTSVYIFFKNKGPVQIFKKSE